MLPKQLSKVFDKPLSKEIPIELIYLNLLFVFMNFSNYLSRNQDSYLKMLEFEASVPIFKVASSRKIIVIEFRNFGTNVLF